MGMSDIIKKSVIEKFDSGNLTVATIAATLGMAVILGLFIYLIYRVTTRSGFYNWNLNKTLACMPLITAGIMLAMQSNLVISLGMVGALSIVRFRNAVKDPIDLTYLFWSISAGIITGAGLFELAVILSLCMTVLVFFLDILPSLRSPCLLVISGAQDASEKDLLAEVKKHCPLARVRSRNVSKRGIEWILELQVKDPGSLIQSVSGMSGILSVNLLSHDGDVRF